jgi:tetratricopeptide (TPR) repeat protein
LAAQGRDLRQGGQYADGLAIAEQAYAAFGELVRQRILPADHPWVLWQAKDLSVARRKMGQLKEALELAEDVYQRYVRSFGEKHPDTLAAGMNVGNARRVHGDVEQMTDLLESAENQVKVTFGLYGEVYGEDHPYSRGCALNLAIVRRRTGDKEGAKQLLEDALVGLQQRLGAEHHYTLTCMAALATSLSETGDLAAAKAHGEQAMEGLRNTVGADHPHTLACASNLANDLKALGEKERSAALGRDTILRYRAILPDDHVDVADALEGKPIALDFEPPPL